MITGNIIYHYNQNEELTNQMSYSIKNDWLPFFFLLSFSVLSVTPKVLVDLKQDIASQIKL